jgi:hypothetical protein
LHLLENVMVGFELIQLECGVSWLILDNRTQMVGGAPASIIGAFFLQSQLS